MPPSSNCRSKAARCRSLGEMGRQVVVEAGLPRPHGEGILRQRGETFPILSENRRTIVGMNTDGCRKEVRIGSSHLQRIAEAPRRAPDADENYLFQSRSTRLRSRPAPDQRIEPPGRRRCACEDQ